MRSIFQAVAATAFVLCLAGATTASAQSLGTFRWQLAPFCNTVTLDVESRRGQFVLTGFDDMCGALRRGAATGSAHFNPDGTVGLAITVVRPDGFVVQHSAFITIAALSGTWSDDSGNSGTFAFNAPSPASGPPRPFTIRGTYGGRDSAASASASSAQVLAEISFGRTLPAAPQARVVHLGEATTASCPGTPALPQAAAGFLCVYERSASNRLFPTPIFDSNFAGGVGDRFGAIIIISNVGSGIYGASGTWAVTIP
jgi:hypothetical protein